MAFELVNEISLDDTNRIARSEPVVDRQPYSEPHDYVYDIFQLNVKDAERVQELLESGNAGSVATVCAVLPSPLLPQPADFFLDFACTVQAFRIGS